MSGAQKLGLFGATLKDVGANLSARPEDANNINGYLQQQRQLQVQQLLAASQSGDADTRQKAYQTALSMGIDPTPFKNMAASSAIPKLMSNMQPQLNPVQVTAPVSQPGAPVQGGTALNDPTRQAAYSTPIQSTPSLSDALRQTGSPELSAQMAPQMLADQESRAKSQVRPATPQEMIAHGYAGTDPGTMNDYTGELTSQVKPIAAVTQAANAPPTRFQTQTATETHRHNVAMEGGALGADGLPLIDDPVTRSWVQNVVSGNATMQQVPAPLRNKVSMALQATPTASYSPLASSRLTMASNRIVSNFIKLPQYELTANGLPYLQRIGAALKTPGSVSDQDLLDSLTKLNTAGNAVTDAQVKIITDGKSLSDWAGTISNKFKNGGVLSENQRKQIKEIANNIYQNYKKGYQPVYDQATSKLKASGIPESFWTIPNLNKLNADNSTAVGASQTNPTPPQPGQSPGAALPRIAAPKKTVRFEDLP